MAVQHFLLTIFAIHRYLLFLATTIRRIPQQQVLRGSIESKAYLSYAADSVGAQLTPLTQLVVPKNLRCALIDFYLLFYNTIRPTAQQQVFCCQSEFSRKLSLAADSVGLVSAPSTQWLGAGLCAQRWADDLCQDTLTLRASVSGRSVEESELSITK